MNYGSTGRIAESIGKLVIAEGGDSYIAYGRTAKPSDSKLIKIGGKLSAYIHVLKTRLFDAHGFASYVATKKFIRELRQIDPDIIHLHNIHGYYVHVGLLFNYLKQLNKPVVWTLHDCWSFTGHCSHFVRVNCDKWRSQCYACPNKTRYPSSWVMDRSRNNYLRKKELFTSVDSLSVVSPSKWLADHVANSFLKGSDISIIHNGIDLEVFRPDQEILALQQKHQLENKKVILGVTKIWSKVKGLDDLISLNRSLHPSEQMILVGLDRRQIKSLPEGIIGIERTANVEELAAFYTLADVYVNPTYLDTFPTTNIEALACGTPVITYDTGGSPEAIDEGTGIVVPKGDVSGLRIAIDKLAAADRKGLRQRCATRAKTLFNKDDRFADYISLYTDLIDRKK